DTLEGGERDDLLFGGPGNDRVNGGSGDDIAFLGAGNDIFLWAPDQGNDRVDGQAGVDAFSLRDSTEDEVFDLSANGSRLRISRDLGNFLFDLVSVEHVALDVSFGADRVTINDLSAARVQQVTIELGGVDADAIVVNGTSGADHLRIVSDPDGEEVRVSG